MSKTVFILLLPFEFLTALLAAAMLFADVGAAIYLIAAAVFCVVLAPSFIRLKREPDEAKKRKIRRKILLLLLIPILTEIILMAVVITFWMRMTY